MVNRHKKTDRMQQSLHRLLALVLALILVAGGVPAYLLDGSSRADKEVHAAGAGDTQKDAPAGFENQDIATITIDNTKIEGVRPSISSSWGGGANVTYAFGTRGYVEASSTKYKEGGSDDNAFPGGGNYTLTYPDAVVYPDGSRGDLEVRFSDIKYAFRTKDDNGNALPSTTFSDDLRVFHSAHASGKPAISAYSQSTNNRFGLRETVTVTATGSSNASNTTNNFIYSGYGFNINRTGVTFSYLAYAAANNNWNEGFSTPGNAVVGTDLTAASFAGGFSGYIGKGGSDNDYTTGFAGTVDNGVSHRVYSSAGVNHTGANSYISPTASRIPARLLRETTVRSKYGVREK